ncbi:MAG: DUF1565 domain-containing protein [Lachnospiraceae bacterium]
MYQVYHVSKAGMDMNMGSESDPFLTINKAAQVAEMGDTIIVHEGTYREWIKPKFGGYTEQNRITYTTHADEKVIIKGSEIIDKWEHVQDGVYKASVSNSIFGDYNPYLQTVDGDWFLYPVDYSVHTGDLYVNGKSFYEASSLENLIAGEVTQPFLVPANGFMSAPFFPEDTIYKWFSIVEDDITTIYANFHAIDPNEALTEINVRKCCFAPVDNHVNYITVRGFEMAHAATTWAPPTAEQVGVIWAHWSKGWIIEDNIIHDSKCAGISIGKEISTGDNECQKWQIKPGFQGQIEAVFRGLQIGWCKEKIGSHIVRNNIVYDCGQNGIVGHMGCAFSEVYGNHVYRVGLKKEYVGCEIAGIKFHAPIDMELHHNYVHDCTLGLWLDWETQGTRVFNNVFDKNGRDCVVEVSHGPYMIDHNIFTAPNTFGLPAQGGAFIHNLIGGLQRKNKILDRSTPYHYPHSTQVAGCTLVYGSDDRIYNNIYIGAKEAVDANGAPTYYGTDGYNGCPTALEEFRQLMFDNGREDIEKFVRFEQPAYIDGNIYYRHAKAFDKEIHNHLNVSHAPELNIIDEDGTLYLEVTLDEAMFDVDTTIHSTDTLGTVRIVDALFDDKNGNPIVFDTDMLGEKHSAKPTAGPIEGLKPGYNKIKIMSYKSL